MKVDELESTFRIQIDDRLEPYLVDSDQFLEYLNEAQQEACIRANLLYQRVDIDILEGQTTYAKPASIYAITTATLNDSANQNKYLDIVDRFEADRIYPDWRNLTDVPRLLINDDSSLEIAATPRADYTLTLDCWMLPKVMKGGSPEISEANHRNLLHWCYHKAYAVIDSDLVEPGISQMGLSRFETIFGMRPRADNRRNQYANRPHSNKATFI